MLIATLKNYAYVFITVAARQRRKSGDDVLNSSAKEKEKKKETSAGFFDYITRPRSKSDASSRLAKKPNLMTTMKNAVQVRLGCLGSVVRF